MAFNVLTTSQKRDADEIMQNFRHINYGSPIKPVDTNGAADTDNLDLGSATYKWNNMYFSRGVAVDGLADVSRASVKNSSDQAIATSSLDLLSWNELIIDSNSLHSTVTNSSRITLPDAGLYLVVGQFRWESNATGVRRIYLMKNGASTIGTEEYVTYFQNDTSIDDWYMPFVWCATFSAADYLEVRGYQTSGGNLDVKASGSYFSAIRIK